MLAVTCVAREGIKATYKCDDQVVTVWQHRVNTGDALGTTRLFTAVLYRNKEYLYPGSSYVSAALWALGLPDDQAYVQHNV